MMSLNREIAIVVTIIVLFCTTAGLTFFFFEQRSELKELNKQNEQLMQRNRDVFQNQIKQAHIDSLMWEGKIDSVAGVFVKSELNKIANNKQLIDELKKNRFTNNFQRYHYLDSVRRARQH